MKRFFKIFVFLVSLFLFACSQSDDGPISLYPETILGENDGYVLKLSLDSSGLIHLKTDTLQVHLDSIWSLTNCFLKNLELKERLEDSVLFLIPEVKLRVSSEDCAAPLYRPDTTLFIAPKNSWKNAREIRMENTDGKFQDSVFLRNGFFKNDTFKIYLDSSFNDPYALPRKTKGFPSVLKNIDSLKERTFYYRLMGSKCTYIIDTCETVLDTIYPASWSLLDTNLVPVRKVCKDSTLRYCLTRDYKNDSLKLGNLQTHLDTLWYTSWYFLQHIETCNALNRVSYTALATKNNFYAYLETFIPESNADCFSFSTNDTIVTKLNPYKMLENPDSVLSVFYKANESRDSL